MRALKGESRGIRNVYLSTAVLILSAGLTRGGNQPGILSEQGLLGRFARLEADAQYRLNRSRNLEDWTTIGTISADAFGSLNFFDLVEPGVPECFYQAVLAEK